MPEYYNGYRSWNAWSVAIWIANDEPLYRLALRCKKCGNARVAAETFIRECGYYATPDGASYTITSVREALAGLE